MSSPPPLEIKILLERFDLEINFNVQDSSTLTDILGALGGSLDENVNLSNTDRQKLLPVDCPQAEFYDITSNSSLANESIENKPFLIDPENFIFKWDQACQCYLVQNQGRNVIKLFPDRQYKMILRPRLMNARGQREDLLFPIVDSEIPLRYNIYVDEKDNEKWTSSYTSSLADFFSNYREQYKMEALIGNEYVAVKLDSLLEGKLETKVEIDPFTFNEPKELPFLNYMIFRATAKNRSYEHFRQDSAVTSSFDVQLSEQGISEKERLKAYIQKVHELYMNPDSNYLAPVINVCQSSGSGKSKLAAELILEVPSFYLTLSQGYPTRSDLCDIILDICFGLNDEPKNVIDYAYKSIVGMHLLLLKALLSDYLDAFKKLLCANGNNLSDTLKTLYNAFVYGTFTGDDLKLFKSTKNWTQVLVNTETGKFSTNLGLNERYPTIMVVTAACEKILDDISDIYKKHSPNSESFPFVLTIDGAAYMAMKSKFDNGISLFRLFRRAMGLLGKTCKLVVLSLVTNTEIVDFNPENISDLVRSDSEIRRSLFPPFILRNNWDILMNRRELIEKPVTYDTMTLGRMILFWLTLGRPLWNSISLERVEYFIERKIIGPGEQTKETYFACWMILTGLVIDSTHEISKLLVKSHMATLFQCNNNSNSMQVYYPSEPALAIAARSILMPRSFDRKKYYDALFKFKHSGAIQAAPIFDILAADICLMAIGKAEKEECNWCETDGLPEVCKSNLFTFEKEEFHLQDTRKFVDKMIKEKTRKSIDSYSLKDSYMITRVDEFVKTMYGKVAYEGIEAYLPEIMKSARLNTTHFMQMSNNLPFELLIPIASENGAIPEGDLVKSQGKVTSEILQAMLMRGAGARFSHSTYGVNHYIPVCLKPEKENGKSRTKNLRPEYSYIGVQLKRSYSSSIRKIMAKGAISSHYVRCGQHGNACPGGCKLRLSDEKYSKILKNGLIFVHCADGSADKYAYESLLEDVDDDQNKQSKKIIFECSSKEFDTLFTKATDLMIQNLKKEITDEEHKRSKAAIKKELRAMARKVCPLEFRDQVDNFMFQSFDKYAYREKKFTPDIYISFPVSKNVSVHVMYKKDPITTEITEKLTAIYSTNLDVFSTVLPSDTIDSLKYLISNDPSLDDD